MLRSIIELGFVREDDALLSNLGRCRESNTSICELPKSI